jgi:hypothetical protein
MKSILATALAILAILVVGAPAAAAEPEPMIGPYAFFPEFFPDPDGLVLHIPGIEGVEAVAEETIGLASGDLVLNQSLDDNTVEERGIDHSSSIAGSFLDNVGIVSVNQDSGNLNNQANVRVLALSASDAQVQLLQIASQPRGSGNVVDSSEGGREDSIVDSFGGMVGVLGVNQSSGNLNQQSNLMVVGLGLMEGGELLALGDDSLAAVFPDPAEIEEISGATEPRSETITGSFSDFRGAAQVTMSSGDLNTLQNVISVSFSVMEGP